MFQLFLFGSVFGAFGIIALQALGLLYLWNRLNRKPKFVSDSPPVGDRDLLGELDPHQSLHFAYKKQVTFSFSFFLFVSFGSSIKLNNIPESYRVNSHDL